jgi:hypothetical protein
MVLVRKACYSKFKSQIFLLYHPNRSNNVDWLPKCWWDFFFKGPSFFFVKKGQSEIQNSSADEKKKKKVIQ